MIPVPPADASQISESTIIGIRHEWAALRRMEASLFPAGAEGLARRRTALLAGIPAFLLPSVIDALNREEAAL